MGTGAGYVCVQLQGSLANMKLKRGVPPPGARSRTRGSREAPGALLRKEVGKIEGNFKTLQPAWAAGLVLGQARPALPTPRLQSPKSWPRHLGRGSEVCW